MVGSEREAGWVETERCLKLLGVALVGKLAAGFGLGLAAFRQQSKLGQMFSALKRLLLLWIVGAAACADGRVAASDAEFQAAAGRAQTDSAFARLIERLSEPGGYFDTDNLISNEASYLHVLGEMRELGVQGGAYIGVGPDQNFSYIAELRPTVAFIIDIRRDNLLQHLLFKSLFVLSRNRVEYLSLLFGRPPPEDAGRQSSPSR